jgi:site-specific DNA recombinase
MIIRRIYDSKLYKYHLNLIYWWIYLKPKLVVESLMPIADLYLRVSTDEQANKGFSLRYQEEVLRQYCNVKDYQIKNIITEDHSAKDFNRPEWVKWLMNAKQHRLNRADFLLFTKWDRFSRNTGDAYYMISVLKKLGIEPVAVEQPLDISIPENKMMMAFYLAIPEVENAWRALNVKQGIWKARREGKLVGLAPIGYKNAVTANGIKCIVPREPQASLMREAFKLVAEGNTNVTQLFRQLMDKGLGRLSNSFRRALKNPIYCGKIKVPAFDDQPAYYVDGVHEPLISEELYNVVQKMLGGKHNRWIERTDLNHRFPFRGLLKCPACGKHLTGSASTGKSGEKFHYYHCQGKCKVRFRTEMVDQTFLRQLEALKPKPEFIEYFKTQIRILIQEGLQVSKSRQCALLSKIEADIQRTHKAEQLMLDGVISGDDYRRIKLDMELGINILGEKLQFIRSQELNVERRVKQAMSTIQSLPQLFEKMDTRLKRNLIRLFFPTPLVSTNTHFLPTIPLEPVRILYGLEQAFK